MDKKCHEGIVRCIKTNGNIVVSGGEDNQVKVWSKADFSKINEFTHLNFVQDILIRSNDIISVSYDEQIIKNTLKTTER